jgi:hypothetical protein
MGHAKHESAGLGQRPTNPAFFCQNLGPNTLLVRSEISAFWDSFWFRAV